MEFRIQAFETLWRNRLLPPPVLRRAPEYDDYLTLARPTLVRQDNRHHLLPDDTLARWYASTSYEEKDEIMMEYEATEWATEWATIEWDAVPADWEYAYV